MRIIKIITVICAGFCISVSVISLATSASTYDLPGPANAFFRGNDVHSWCQNNRSMALAYTAGLWDLSSWSVLIVQGLTPIGHASDAAVNFALERLGRFCEPHHVVVEQATDVFCAYLRDVPERRNDSAAILFSNAMKKAWPCKRP
jgi:hypothetical protein